MTLAKTILIWIIGIMFIATGLMKLAHMDSMSAEIFERAHYPAWFFYLVGLAEFSAGVLVLITSTRRYGFILISGVMAGAIGTHIYLHDNLGHVVVPALLILFSGYMVMKKKIEETNL